MFVLICISSWVKALKIIIPLLIWFLTECEEVKKH